MRIAVPPKHAYKLINHGPTTLITSAHQGRSNVMAAAWVTPLDTDPPRRMAVVSAETFTRELVEKSGEFVVNLPTVKQAEATYRAGKLEGRKADKIRLLGLQTAPAAVVGAPLVEGCVGWIECRLRDEPAVRTGYDLLIGDVVAAWADDAAFVDGEWRFEGEARTLHHLTKGTFLAIGERIEVQAG